LSLEERNDPRDFVTVCDELERRPDNGQGNQLAGLGGAAYITSLINACATSLNIDSYAGIILRTSSQRKLIAANSAISEFAFSGIHPDTGEMMKADEMWALAERTLINHMHGSRGSGVGAKHIKDVLEGNLAQQEALAEGKRVPGIDPVLPSLRKVLPFSVLQRGWNVGVGANPKMGKSMYVANLIVVNLLQGKNIFLVGTEMLAEEMGNRMIPMMTYLLREKVPDITTADLFRQVYGQNDAEGKQVKQRVIQHLNKLLTWVAEQCPGNLLIVDEPLKVSTLRSAIVREQMTWGPFDLIVVDHIGMMVPEGRVYSETQKMNEISGDLLNLGKSSLLGHPTLLFVSPFTKGEATDVPGMHRFRDTFMLAHNAHLLLGIYEDVGGNKLLHIAGQRSSNGESGMGRDIPVIVREQDGVIVEATAEKLML
jgi:replicative DNA helicase